MMGLLKRVKLWIKEFVKVFRSYYFCFKYLPYRQAKIMPVFLDVPIKIYDFSKGRILIKEPIKPRQIWFGEGVAGLSNKPTCIEVQEGGRLEFSGNAHIARGCLLRVDSNAILKFGNNAGLNCNCFIRCAHSIIIGDDVLMGWNNEISDSDGHDVWLNDIPQIKCKPILIGDHVWLTSYTKIGKGVEIAHDCIVAKGAVVVKSHLIPNSLIGGVPAKMIQDKIRWEK